MSLDEAHKEKMKALKELIELQKETKRPEAPLPAHNERLNTPKAIFNFADKLKILKAEIEPYPSQNSRITLHETQKKN